MKMETNVEPPWPRARWITVVVVLTIFQALAVTVLTRSPSSAPPRSAASTALLLPADPTTFRGLERILELHDPTLLPLAGQNLLPGGAPGTNAPQGYDPALSVMAGRPARASGEMPARTFAQFAETARQPAAVPTQKVSPPDHSLSRVEEPAPSSPRIWLAGRWAGRPWRSSAPQPNHQSATLLSNTVVRVMIDASGRALWTTLLSSSGSSEADRQARAFARTMSFESGENSDSMPEYFPHDSRDLVFQWFPAAGTNAPAAAPPAP